MKMHAVAATYRLGQHVGGEEGGALVQSALAALAAEGIRSPARWVAILRPRRVGPALTPRRAHGRLVTAPVRTSFSAWIARRARRASP